MYLQRIFSYLSLKRNLLFAFMLILSSLCYVQTVAASGPTDSSAIEQIKLKTNLAANCNLINWATWGNFTGRAATGTINNSGDLVNVTMTSDFDFGSTSTIYNYAGRLAQYPANIPNSTVPKTTWVEEYNQAQGTTTMCFSKTVTNPVLLFASLGSSNGTASKLTFDVPYVVLYDGGGMTFHDKYSLTGIEGYAVVMFPGDFNCVTIHSTTYEYYTNITWGLKPPPFQVNVNEVSSICGSTTLKADADAGAGAIYQWDSGDTPNSATNTFHQSGTYVVTVTTADGCKSSVSKTITVTSGAEQVIVTGSKTGCGSVTLIASGGTNYQWSGGDNPTSAANTFHESGYYTLTWGSGLCRTNTTMLVTVNAQVTPVITETANVCGSVTLRASGGTTYQWSGGDTPNSATNTFHQSGTYKVAVFNDAGCSSTIDKTIVVSIAPAPVITGNTAACGSVTVTASGGVNYTWSGGDTPNSATNTFHQSGSYTVLVTGASGCTNTANVQVTVNPLVSPSISISALPAGAACAGTPVTYTANVQNAGNTTAYQWYKNGITVGAGNTYTLNNALDGDRISCTVSTINPCISPSSATSNIIVQQVAPVPTVSFVGGLELYADESGILHPNVSDNVAAYSWSPVSGLSNPTVKNPTAYPQNTTQYMLTVTTTEGCSASASVTVTVRRDLTVYNTFTPNGDGINDTWKIGHLNTDDVLSVDIFNRYGTKVFHSVGYPKAWDGTFNNKPVPAGVYFYVIAQSRQQQPLKGYVTVLR